MCSSDLCSESIERNPYVVSAYQVRGLSRIKMNNIKGAISDYEKALVYGVQDTLAVAVMS